MSTKVPEARVLDVAGATDRRRHQVLPIQVMDGLHRCRERLLKQDCAKWFGQPELAGYQVFGIDRHEQTGWSI